MREKKPFENVTGGMKKKERGREGVKDLEEEEEEEEEKKKRKTRRQVEENLLSCILRNSRSRLT